MTPTSITADSLRDHPLPPVIAGDKETKGRILILAGSRAIPGAALLAATAAMRAGAGKLRIATVESAAMPLAIAMPEAMVTGLPEADDGGFAPAAADAIRQAAEEADVVVAGPGVKESDVCRQMTDVLLESDCALALDVAFLRTLRPIEEHEIDRASRPVLLPNAPELAALLDSREEDIEADPIGAGRCAAQRFRSIVLVKGVDSHVVTPDGGCWRFEGGAPGLGVSGSGDVLAGIVGGLLARGAEPLNALLWGVWLHGKAGERLTEKVGPLGFLAREIADELPGLLRG